MQHYGPAVAAQPQLCQQIFLWKYYKLFDCMLDEKFPAGCRAECCVLCEEHEVRCTECSPEHKTSNSNLSPYSPTLQGTISHLNVIKVSLYKDWYYLYPIPGNTLNMKVNSLMKETNSQRYTVWWYSAEYTHCSTAPHWPEVESGLCCVTVLLSCNKLEIITQ